MTLHEQLLKYLQYGLNMKTSTTNGEPYYIVSLTYPEKWIVMEPTDGEVSCLPSSNENEKSKYYYFTPVIHGIDPIFDTIEEVVSFNEELEKKGELMKIKAQELNQLFMTEPYEKLLTLQFTFPQDTPKRGRPSKKNKKQEETSQEPEPEAQNTPVEKTLSPEPINEPEPTSEAPKPGENIEEANDIDQKIAAALKRK